tara:strand:- start:234 stop:482 length:249 start_codon:yes stop_codon:yes gene_type:complete
MEKARVWAILFRMSTESSIMLKTPFEAKEFDGTSEQDQIDAGAWCLGRMGGAWLPLMFICGTQSEAEKVKEELLERIQQDEE